VAHKRVPYRILRVLHVQTPGSPLHACVFRPLSVLEALTPPSETIGLDRDLKLSLPPLVPDYAAPSRVFPVRNPSSSWILFFQSRNPLLLSFLGITRARSTRRTTRIFLSASTAGVFPFLPPPLILLHHLSGFLPAP